MSRVIVVTSGKGGVGKTTVCANLGLNLARKNYRVCVVDMYPVGVCDSSFAGDDDVTGLHCLGRLGVGAVHPYLASLACICGLASGLEYPYGPEVFVYSQFFHFQ